MCGYNGIKRQRDIEETRMGLTSLIGLGTMKLPHELFSMKLPRYLLVVLLYNATVLSWLCTNFSSSKLLRTTDAVKPVTWRTTLDKSVLEFVSGQILTGSSRKRCTTSVVFPRRNKFKVWIRKLCACKSMNLSECKIHFATIRWPITFNWIQLNRRSN